MIKDRQDIQFEALGATDSKQRCSVVLGTGELLTFKSE